jgi:hypothetical protein
VVHLSENTAHSFQFSLGRVPSVELVIFKGRDNDDVLLLRIEYNRFQYSKFIFYDACFPLKRYFFTAFMIREKMLILRGSDKREAFYSLGIARILHRGRDDNVGSNFSCNEVNGFHCILLPKVRDQRAVCLA